MCEMGDVAEVGAGAGAGGLLRRTKSGRLLPIGEVRSTVALAGCGRRSKSALGEFVNVDAASVGGGTGAGTTTGGGGGLLCSGVLGRDGLKRRSKSIELLAATTGLGSGIVLSLGVGRLFDLAAGFAVLDLASVSPANLDVLGCWSPGASE